MRDIDWKDIMNKIKKWYEELSGASKFVIVLTALLIISNVIINIWSNKTCESTKLIIENIISDEKRKALRNYGVYWIVAFILEFAKNLLFLIISVIAYRISLYVGKLLGFFKLIAKFLSDINEDPFFVKILLIYDLIGVFFDIYTVYSLVIV